jgi:hypothetical protein
VTGGLLTVVFAGLKSVNGLMYRLPGRVRGSLILGRRHAAVLLKTNKAVDVPLDRWPGGVCAELRKLLLLALRRRESRILQDKPSLSVRLG